MLTIDIPAVELLNEATMEFVYTDAVTLHMEYSLISISKWESKFKKPFLTKDDKTPEEIAYLYKCMCIDKNVPDIVFLTMPGNISQKIWDYINDPMTATTITRKGGKKGGRGPTVTSELIYYWMIANQVPMECEKWHLNRLITLIEICNIKNQPPKKMSSAETMRQNAALNAARRAKYRTKG